MAKIYQRLLSYNIPREKRQDSFDPQRVNLFGEDSLFVIRGYLAFLTPSRSSFTLKCFRRGLSVSLLKYFAKN